MASEFYKLIPKAKKEDYDIDSLIDNPKKEKPKNSQKQAQMSLLELAIEIP